MLACTAAAYDPGDDMVKPHAAKSEYAFLLRGFDNAPITNIRVTDCTFDGVARPDVLESVRGLVLKNVRVNGVVRTETVNR
jgi:hypothetical protein